MNEDRMIIGQSEIAGLPISAPVCQFENGAPLGTLRWLMRKDSFELQQYRHWDEPTPGIGWAPVAVSVEAAEAPPLKTALGEALKPEL